MAFPVLLLSMAASRILTTVRLFHCTIAYWPVVFVLSLVLVIKCSSVNNTFFIV